EHRRVAGAQHHEQLRQLRLGDSLVCPAIRRSAAMQVDVRRDHTAWRTLTTPLAWQRPRPVRMQVAISQHARQLVDAGSVGASCMDRATNRLRSEGLLSQAYALLSARALQKTGFVEPLQEGADLIGADRGAAQLQRRR